MKKENRRRGLVAGVVALALGMAGCEGDSLYEGVAIHPASVQLKVGQVQMFMATGGQDYEWSFEPVDGRLGMNTRVGDTVVVVAQSSTADGEAEEAGAGSVITLTCRSVIPGVTSVATNGAESVAAAYISIR